MSNDTPTTPMPSLRGAKTLDERLDIIETLLRNIMDNNGKTEIRVALIERTLELHDKILMAVCGTVGLSVLVAVIALVVRSK